MFAPDLQGPIASATPDLIINEQPQVLMLGGPPLYLAGYRVDPTELERGVRNLTRIVETIPLVIVEHHALRDEAWRQKLESMFEAAAGAGHVVQTAAEFAGEPNRFLEATRKQLYRDYPPSAEFLAWMKTLNNKTITKPPL
jgi:predicted metallo-beta-lactamase superfamily hydrolase